MLVELSFSSLGFLALVNGLSSCHWAQSHLGVHVTRHGPKLLGLSAKAINYGAQRVFDIFDRLVVGDFHAEQCRGSTIAFGREEQLPEFGIG
ncbi:MAG TPA: hypothetical protein EYN37_02345 [Dehalococcoidia bacterium]|jgi:hypothetical protein|nr:hypothetical protein [Dehalococcoidia bacterium]